MPPKTPKVTTEVLKHGLPLFFTVISAIISLYFFRFKTQLKDELRTEFVSKSAFDTLQKVTDRTMKSIEDVPAIYVSKEVWRPIADKVQNEEVAQGKIETSLVNLEKMMKEMRDDIKEIRRQGAR